MSPTQPVLHLLSGKIAAGKSTLAARLGAAPATVLIAEDTWLDALFGDQLQTVPDYLRCSAKLRGVIGPHIADLLGAGVSVVLDLPANTREVRGWMQGILDRSGAAHALHLLEVPDGVCLARLRARNASGAHPFAPTEEQFLRITGHFLPPAPDEGFVVVRHAWTGD